MYATTRTAACAAVGYCQLLVSRPSITSRRLRAGPGSGPLCCAHAQTRSRCFSGGFDRVFVNLTVPFRRRPAPRGGPHEGHLERGTPRPHQPARLPPRRHPRPPLAHGVTHRLSGGRRADPLAPRLPPHRRPQPDPRQRPRAGRHAPDRPQEPRHLRPLAHNIIHE